MKVSAQYAREHLDDLLAAAGSGEEVEIARPNQFAFRFTLVRLPASSPATASSAGWVELIVPSFDKW